MTYLGNQPADVAVVVGADAVGTAEITDDSIVNADIKSDAAIATSKISGAVTSIGSHGLGSLATLSTVAAATITDDSVGADELNVSGDGSSGQALLSDADGTFSWGSGGDSNAGGANGSAASPTFSFTSDTNTGMYRGGADNLAFATGGTERTRIADDGKVGIGAADPVTQLEIRGDASTPGATLTLSTADTEVVDGDILGRIDFRAPKEAGGTDAILPGASIWGEANDGFAADVNDTHIVFACNNSGATTSSQERMRIQGNGMVGIGVADPDSTLEVNGNIHIDDAVHGDGGSLSLLPHAPNTTTSGNIKFYTADGTTQYERMRIDNDGFVGIGTGSPTAELEISADSPSIYLSGAAGDNNFINFREGGTHKWGFYSEGATDNMRLLDAGWDNGVQISQNATSWAAVGSDERRKTDWNDSGYFDNALDKINTLTKVGTYKTIDPVTKEYINEEKTLVGISAQEVEAILPPAVTRNRRPIEHYPDDDTEYLGLAYQDVFVMLIKAVQELSAKVEALESA